MHGDVRAPSPRSRFQPLCFGHPVRAPFQGLPVVRQSRDLDRQLGFSLRDFLDSAGRAAPGERPRILGGVRMDALGLLLHGFQSALTLNNLFFCFIGVTVGQFIGVLTWNRSGIAGTAVLIPLTFGMNPTSAIIMLAGIFYAAMYGGTITSVLINTPGESASVITCIDGYQMARQGRAGAALGVAAIGSFIGGVVAALSLTVDDQPVVAVYALHFGHSGVFAWWWLRPSSSWLMGK